MKAVIDTNILIDLFNGIEEARIEILKYNSPIISIITWMEIFVGVKDINEKKQLEKYFSKFKIDEINQEIADMAITIRQSEGKKLPDAIIEATAKANETILVTRNTKDFNKSHPHIRIPYELG